MEQCGANYRGVYKKVLKSGDISYYYVFKDKDKKNRWIKYGNKSDGTTARDTFNKRAEVLKDIRDGKVPDLGIKTEKASDTLDLDTIAKKYFEYLYNKDKTPNKRNTKETLGKYHNRLAPIFGHLELNSIRKDAVQTFLDRLKNENLADATVNNYHSILKSIINYGIDNFEELENFGNVASKIRMIPLDNNRQRILSIQELHQALEAFSDKPKKYLFFGLLMQTGARPISILKLRKVDVNLDNGVLKIQGLKKGKTYETIISDTIAQALKIKLTELENHHYVFHPDNPKTNPNKMITYESMRHQIQPTLERMFNQGLPSNDRINRVTFYTLRHSFATHMAQDPSISIFDLKNLMGHNQLKMTDRYAKIAFQESTKNAVKNLFDTKEK